MEKYKLTSKDKSAINKFDGIYERKFYKKGCSILENKNCKMYIDDYKILQGFNDDYFFEKVN